MACGDRRHSRRPALRHGSGRCHAGVPWVATIGINVVGWGFGPLGTLAIKLTDGSSLVIPDAGRGIDQNGDNMIGLTEGTSAAAPRTWTIGARDNNLQNAIDLMQLVRVIEVGMDVNGDGSPDLDPNRISYFGNSGGGIYGAVFLALEPNIYAAAAIYPGTAVSRAWAMGPRHASQPRTAASRSSSFAAQRSRNHDD